MSAIAGILYFDGVPVEPGLIQKLTGAMASRGPDEQTHWSKGSVALGHCMLRTTPESLEEYQPLLSQDKNLVLVWDGRLDNRDELRRNLRSSEVSLRDNTDAELVLQSYIVWGENSPKYLLGDFAFAVWDARQNHLFCVHDHMGARPFYYTQNDRLFAFASEDRALCKLPGVSNQPNGELLAHILYPDFNDFDPARSWLKDISSLMPAQSLTVNYNAQHQTDTYWHLEPGEEAIYTSDAECQAAFLDVFGEAVKCRMRILGHPAAMISGGLDSASISAMVKRLLLEMPGKEFHSYSAISDQPQSCIETQCILSLTKDLGRNAHTISVPSAGNTAIVPDMIEIAWNNPHPVFNYLLMPALLCQMASRQGDRVLLHGASGDTTMYLPNRYVAYHLRAGEWKHAWQECIAASHYHTYLRGTSPLRLFLLNCWTAWSPELLKTLVSPLRKKPSGFTLDDNLIAPAFAEKLGLYRRLKKPLKRLPSYTNKQIAQSPQRALLATLSPFNHIASGLMGFDGIAGRYGIEARSPWADRRVLEFFLRLPPKYKIRNGRTKYLVRSAFADDLDDSVRWRLGKEHLGYLFIKHLMDTTDNVVSATFEKGLEPISEYADINALQALRREYLAHGGEAEQDRLYGIVTLARWLNDSLGLDK